MILELATLGLAVLSDGEAEGTEESAQRHIRWINRQRKKYGIHEMTTEEIFAFLLEEPPPLDEYLVTIESDPTLDEYDESIHGESILFFPIVRRIHKEPEQRHHPNLTGLFYLEEMEFDPKPVVRTNEDSVCERKQRKLARSLYLLHTGGQVLSWGHLGDPLELLEVFRRDWP